MKMGGEDMAENITVESCPFDTTVPSWVVDEIATGRDDLLVIYPNEVTRASSIQTILEKAGSVDSSRHTTLQRLLKSLTIDLRLPVLVPRTSTGLVQVHEKFASAAQDHRFPRLHPDVTRPWTLSKSERLLSLHAYATKHGILSTWEGDPGAFEADRILSTFESEDLLHEHHVIARICSALTDLKVPTPYTLGAIRGILLLNHPPDFHKDDKQFLKALSVRSPIHHLCVTGSFRLGFHGAYIDDELPLLERNDQLPEWVPHHAVLPPASGNVDYATEGIHLLSFDRASQIPDAAISVINHFNKRENGRILLIDADKGRHKEWIRSLQRVGITCDTQADSVGTTSAIQAILRFLSIPNGQDAWSTAKLFDIAQSKAFPIIGSLFSDLSHPEKKDWRPRPHLDVIENIGRSFHVLGGKGALQRWLGSLSVAKPYAVEAYRREEELRAIEETQWWLQCLSLIHI